MWTVLRAMMCSQTDPAVVIDVHMLDRLKEVESSSLKVL